MARSKIARLLSRSYEITLRGWFVVNGLKRLAKAEDKRAQLEKEKLFFRAHQKMRDKRLAAAEMIDAARYVYGDVLGWYLGPLENHCPICLGAEGKNFKSSRRPGIGWPSSAHPNCDCSPGAPWPQGQMIR